MATSPVRKIPSRLQADVVVVGSGLAGVSAAIQAARLGCTVILLEKDEVFGGNSGPNLGIHISGAHSFHPYASETGIVNELEEEASFRSAKTYSYRYHYNISRLWDSLLEEHMRASGVLCLRRSYAKRAVTRDGRIEAIVFEDLATYRTRRVEVKVCVVDASGDGQIAYTAGAEFDYGREARSEFGERSAPEKRDRKVMGTSLTALVRKTQRAVKFHPPPGTPPFEPGYGYGRDKVSKDCLLDHSSWNPDADLCFLWHTETGGDMDTIEDEHEIYERLLLQLYSVWNHIKNEAHQRESLNWELLWVSPKAGKRESRRFVGDYVLTQTDVEEGRRFPDAVAYGGYAVDVHEPRGVQAKVIFHSIPPLYDIPYRSLYSRNVENLLLAGRLVSVTHLALGTVRLQKTLAAAGQAVGVAAALCKRYGCTPRQVWQEHMEELQQLLLREDATIVGVTNRDPGDLARGARVEATSEEFFQCTKNFHNALQGTPVSIPESALRHYEEVNARNAEAFRELLQEADLVFVHDPQPAAMLKFCPDRKGKWVWRCHIDISRPYRAVWKYLRPLVASYDASIFSIAEFAQALPHPLYIIPPSIDPLSEKNRDLPPEEVEATYRAFQIDLERPVLLQVSRFDRFKDPLGVIQAYRLAKKFVPALQLVLAGGGAVDDPEAEAVLQEVEAAAADDPNIHVLFLPPEADRTINALQRGADVVLQKSLREGFGLTVTEAMWKAKPVVASNVGGIKLQIEDGVTGYLRNTEEGQKEAIMRLLTDEILYKRMQENCLIEAHKYAWESVAKQWEKII